MGPAGAPAGRTIYRRLVRAPGMEADDPDGDADESLPAGEIADRFADIEEGDRVRFNDRDGPFEVVTKDRYSLTVVDGAGNGYTISQNLQTGAWTVHRDLEYLERLD